MPILQAERRIAVSSPLGEDVLLFRAMRASESLGRLSTFDLDLLSEDHEIKLEDVLGQNLTVRLDMPQEGATRFFNGFASQFCYAGWSGDFARYRATLKPWPWFLTRTADNRIFQEKTVPDIIEQVFGDQGFTDFELRLNGSYRTWEYCVQYRETDFNFVSRLMEQEGIYYYFLHEDGKHWMVLADAPSAHEPVAGYEEVPYFPPEEGGQRERDHISEWSVRQEVQPGAYTLRDFDFEKSDTDLEVRLSKPFEHAQAEHEVYDYPGEYVTRGEGEDYVEVRLEELHSQHELAEGEGDVAGLAAGGLFKLTGYPREDQNREYLLVACTVELRSDAYVSEGAAKGETLCHCQFTAMDGQRPFRASRKTPKPVVQGPQTAIVVGKAGEEIWTDKHGRVKVQFHWDREGKLDENSSCWIRVSYPWAGKGWGGIHIPRIAQEVIVDFLEGDPDRPIITGRVYNDYNKPPYGLPDGAVISGLKSETHKGGGYNEISVDDTAGNEKVTIHGQYNMDTTVENDQTLTVHNNRTDTIDVDDSETVGSNQTLDVGSDQTVNIGSNQTTSVGSARSVSVGTNQDHSIGANLSMSSGANTEISAGANIDVSAGGVITLSSGGSSVEITPGGINISSAGPVTITGAVVKVNS
jgi:type VI secretion system secreted protein VgrG